MISEEWRSELLSKINIEQVVGEYVSFTNKGGRLWACCPFHNEKTPSFTVNTEKQFYHCFGCHKGGNVINFIMEIEKMTYPEACQFLADKVGMTMPEVQDKTSYEKNKQERERIWAINKDAAKFFHDSLYAPAGAEALAYYKEKRGLTDAVIKAFGLGYADKKWDSVIEFLQAKGYSVSEISKAGLCKLKDGKSYDVFRNRPIMPIIDIYSHVIGFGGRALDADDNPKYLNTAETPAYNKRKNLYNLNMVRKLKDLKYVILAEGYMDVIALCSHGFKNTVATLGTALTPEQTRLLSRYTNNIYISYDGDEAGLKAALRAVDIVHEAGLEPRVVMIPDKKDPDEFLKEFGPEAYTKLLQKAYTRLDFKFHLEKLKVDISTGEGREAFLKSAVEILKKEDSAIVKEKYARLLSKATGFSEKTILEEIGGIKKESFTFKKKEPETKVKEFPVTEKYVLLRLLEHPQAIGVLVEKLGMAKEDFTCEIYGKIFSVLNDSVKEGFSVSGAEILSRLENDEERCCAAELLESNTDSIAPGQKKDSFFADCIKDMKKRNLILQRERLLKQRDSETDSERRSAILNEIQIINKKLNNRELF